MADHHALGGGEVLLEGRGIHVLLAAAVADRHLFRAEEPGLNGRVDGRHAAADDDDAPADRDGGLVRRLPQFRNEIDGVDDARKVFAFRAERVDAGKAHAEEDGVEIGSEVGEGEVAAELQAVLHLDAADREHVVDFVLREIVDRLVGGDAVFVEAAGFLARLEDHDVVAVHGEAMGAGKARRSGADDGDRLAGARRALVELPVLLHRDVGGVALQAADLHRALLGGVAHAGLFAQRLGGTDAGAHAAEDVLVEDGLRRAERIARRDLADEQRNVDGGGTGRHARRVVAEVAAVCGHQRLMVVEARVKVGKVRLVFGRRKTPPMNPRLRRSHHYLPFAWAFWIGNGNSALFFYQTVKFHGESRFSGVFSR